MQGSGDLGPERRELLDAVSRVTVDALIVVEGVEGDELDFRCVWCNEAAARLVGITSDAAVGLTYLQLFPTGGELLDRLVDAWLHGHEAEGIVDVDPDVAPALRRVQYRVARVDTMLVLTIVDRSAELSAELRAAALEQLIVETAQQSTVPSAILRPVVSADGARVEDLEFEFVNDLAADLLALPADHIVGLRALTLTQQPAIPGGFVERVGQSWLDRRPEVFEVGFESTALAGRFLRCQTIPLGDVVVVHVDDVTRKREIEEALIESEERYRAIVEHADVLIALTDAQGRVVFVNDLLARTLGSTRDDIVGRPSVEFYAPEDRPRAVRDFKALVAGERVHVRNRFHIVGADATLVPTVGAGVALTGNDDIVDGIVIVGADITELVAQEHARRDLAAALAVAEQSERERLAADLHDGPVQTLTALSMRFGAATLDPTAVDAELAVRTEAALSDTIRELRTLLFQLKPPDLEAGTLGQALRQRAEHLVPGAVVELDDRLRRPLGASTVEPLFRVAQEAIVNIAKHARASRVRIDLRDAGRDVVIEIDDDGVGAEPAAFTRRSAGHLGVLGMVDRARMLGGHCEIASQPGAGTNVFIRVPRDVDAAIANDVSSPEE